MIDWGKDDCLAFLFGPKVHEFEWIASTHDEALRKYLAMDYRGRHAFLMRCIDAFDPREIIKPDVGCIAVGNFMLANSHIPIAAPWAARCGKDYLFRIKRTTGVSVITWSSQPKFYQCLLSS